MRNFDDAVDLKRKGIEVPVPERANPELVSHESTYLMKPDSEWGWRDLRDYIRWSCQRIGFSHETDSRAEQSIYSSFLRRYPNGIGIKIARYVVELTDGRWHGYPVTEYTFRKSFDEEFAQAILRLMER